MRCRSGMKNVIDIPARGAESGLVGDRERRAGNVQKYVQKMV